MEREDALHLLQALIDYFEAGNRQTDGVAKDIIDTDFEYRENWQAEIRRGREGGKWTGLRAPEAEIIASALRTLQTLLEESDKTNQTRGK